jgi:hypothetical protein
MAVPNVTAQTAGRRARVPVNTGQTKMAAAASRFEAVAVSVLTYGISPQRRESR